MMTPDQGIMAYSDSGLPGMLFSLLDQEDDQVTNLLLLLLLPPGSNAPRQADHHLHPGHHGLLLSHCLARAL